MTLEFNIVKGAICACTTGRIGIVKSIRFDKEYDRVVYIGSDILNGSPWQSVSPKLLGYIPGVPEAEYIRK